ncbi:hypothetical protein TNCV_2781261 [Trichonephila clavipes]|nr:hypothetical protein TNCV_2781261 [Trichonephila clavipes]
MSFSISIPTYPSITKNFHALKYQTLDSSIILTRKALRHLSQRTPIYLRRLFPELKKRAICYKLERFLIDVKELAKTWRKSENNFPFHPFNSQSAA